jgi:hypothetical protein
VAGSVVLYVNNNNNNNNNSYSNNIEMSIQTNKAKNSFNNNNNKFYKFYRKQGHLIDNCFKKNPKLNKKLNLNTSKKSINTSSSLSNNLEELESKQENILISSSYNNNNKISFILDSGATIYTYYNKELFNNINNTTTVVEKHGEKEIRGALGHEKKSI